MALTQDWIKWHDTTQARHAKAFGILADAIGHLQKQAFDMHISEESRDTSRQAWVLLHNHFNIAFTPTN